MSHYLHYFPLSLLLPIISITSHYLRYFPSYQVRCQDHHRNHCNALQRTETHRNAPQHTAAHCSTLHYSTTLCNTLQHTAIHCNTLQHTATHCDVHCNELPYLKPQTLNPDWDLLPTYIYIKKFQVQCQGHQPIVQKSHWPIRLELRLGGASVPNLQRQSFNASCG